MRKQEPRPAQTLTQAGRQAAPETAHHDQHILVKEFIQGIVIGLLAGVLVGYILFA